MQSIIEQLTEKKDMLIRSTQAAHEAATHEESSAEHRYDTRGLEASYLAGAQAKRVAELEQTIQILQRIECRAFEENEPIAVNALVQLEGDEGEVWYFIVPRAGGLKLSHQGQEIAVLTPKSPLAQKLLGAKVGDEIDVRVRNRILEYDVLAVL